MDEAAENFQLFQSGDHRMHGLCIDERSHERVGIERVSNSHLAVGSYQRFQQRFFDRFVHDESASCRTTLACGSDSSKQQPSQREAQIGGLGHDHGIVATEFQERTTKSMRHGFRDRSAHASRTRRRDEWDARVFREQAPNDGAAHRQTPERGVDA